MANDQIVDPQVLFVRFERHKGKWRVKIPNGFGKDQDFIAPIRDDLELQFQPVSFKNIMAGGIITGVGCLPMLIKRKKGGADAVPEQAKKD